jgi:6-hydroxypseudooxynicotine dehydrogenase subunit alpha
MKPPPFDYVIARDVEHAVETLREVGDDAKLLAGGQSLVPLLSLRLARPSLLVDVNRIPRMSDIRVDEGRIRFGALVRHHKLETSSTVAREFPLLREAAGWIAHPQIRTRGTLGGSLAHADSAAELPVVLAALDATVTARSAGSERTISVAELSVAHLVSCLEPDEMITEVQIPRLPAGTGTAFDEFARRHGDYAIGGAAAVITLNQDGVCIGARIAVLGAGDPGLVRRPDAENRLIGTDISPDHLDEVAAEAVTDLRPPPNLHADARYRRDVIRTMITRTVRSAVGRARSRA